MVQSHTGLLTRIRHHREDVAARHQLARELADFATPAERLELDTIIARHREADRRQVEALLAAQTARQMFTR
jgi:hypothetical protein